MGFGAAFAVGVFGTVSTLLPAHGGLLGSAWAATGHPAGAAGGAAALGGAWWAAKWAERVLRWTLIAGGAAPVGHLTLAHGLFG